MSIVLEQIDITERFEPSHPRPRHQSGPRPGYRTVRQRSWLARLVGPFNAQRVFVVLVAFGAIGAAVFPVGTQWFTARGQDQTVSAYAEQVQGTTPTGVTAAIAAAHAYNDRLRPSQLLDPYTNSEQPGNLADDPAYQEYLDTLNVTGDGPDSAMMGYLSIPAIDSYLPIYHGTTAATLDQGIGHMFGSALPVGGAGTHSVLTAHAGLVNAKLFTDLAQVKIGDTFAVTVYDQRFTYQVDQILVVLPNETDALMAEPGQDYMTLVTCTPTGINSHRLLVRGFRIPNDQAATGQVIPVAPPATGFPWWALLAAAAVLVVLLATRMIALPRRVRIRILTGGQL